jgi:hypothetical protein
VPAVIASAVDGLNLGFNTYLDFLYQVRWKATLTSPEWGVLTNVTGDGALKFVTMNAESDSGFFRVLQLCN